MFDDFMIFIQTLEVYEKDIFTPPEFLHTFYVKNLLSRIHQKI
jgi:hypothetical protein